VLAERIGDDPVSLAGTRDEPVLPVQQPMVPGVAHEGYRAAPQEQEKTKTREGHKLRRYKRRWKLERLFAWLSNFQSLVVCYERRAENYLGFVRPGCIVILLKYL
jgi:transposase